MAAMCDICEGASDDELLFGIHGRKLNFGWAIEYVWADEPLFSWGYTIGLTERFGHPELTVAGRCAEHTGRLLNALGRAIQEGRLDGHDGSVSLDGVGYNLLEVHPGHYEAGTFAMWEFYYRALGWGPPEHRVLEIVALDERPRFTSEPAHEP